MAYFRSEIRRTSYYKAHYDLAILLSKRGRVREAILHYKKAARRGATRAERSDALNNLALLFLRKGLTSQAISTFREAIRQNPQNAAPRVNLGFQFLQTGDKRRGQQSLERASRLGRLDPSGQTQRWVGYALIKYDLDVRKGVRMLEQVLARDPTDSATRSDIAVGYMKLGQHVKATSIAGQRKGRARLGRETN